jgi:hypothetical protein
MSRLNRGGLAEDHTFLLEVVRGAPAFEAGQSGEQARELLGSPNLWRGRRFTPITLPEGGFVGRRFALCEP